MMRLRAGVRSDRGLVRPANEDSFFLRRGLYAVCDGMGGARAGEVASEMACLGLLALDPALAGKKDLRTAIVNTNRAIVSRSLAEDHLLGMGTTLTAVLVREGSLILAHVGDSRAYLFRDDSLIQLTDDHSWVGEMVRRGELTPDQAAIHPHRSVITRALGTDGDLEPDMTEMDVGSGDRILLCSDGLSNFVSDADMAELLRRDELPQPTAELLVKAALAGGGEDNVTVVIVDVLAGEDQGGDESHVGDQVGDRMLIGPSDRGALPAASLLRGKRAAAVRGRLSRRAAPTLRPVATRSTEASPPAEVSSPTEAHAVAEDAFAVEGSLAVAGLPSAGDAPTAEESAAAETASVGESRPADKAPPSKRSRRRWIYFAVALALVVVIAAGGFAVFNSTVYYVGAYDGAVALYRGLPGSFLGIDLSSVLQLSSVQYDSLASYVQKRVDAHDRVSKEEGRAFLEALDEQQ